MSSLLILLLAIGAASVASAFVPHGSTPFEIVLGCSLALIATSLWGAWEGSSGPAPSAVWPGIVSMLLGLVLFLYPWSASADPLFIYGASVAGLGVLVVSGYEGFVAGEAAPRPHRA